MGKTCSGWLDSLPCQALALIHMGRAYVYIPSMYSTEERPPTQQPGYVFVILVGSFVLGLVSEDLEKPIGILR